MSKSSFLGADTIALHSGYQPESDHGSRAVPIYQTTSYVFDSVDEASALFNVEQGGHIYSRITNPTVAVLEQRLAALEGGAAAICTASGMSALFVSFLAYVQLVIILSVPSKYTALRPRCLNTPLNGLISILLL